MSSGGLYQKDSGKDVVWPSEMVHKETDSEALVYALGELLNILMERDIITAQEAIDIVPYAGRYYTAHPSKADTASTK